MAFHSTDYADPAWPSLITARKAVLWISNSLRGAIEDRKDEARSVFARSWHSIYIDSFNPSELLKLAADSPSLKPLTLRVVEGDPDETTLATNRVPIYIAPSGGPADPCDTLFRLKMFQRIPNTGTVFALVSDPSVDLPSLQQALQVAGGVREVVVICESVPVGDLAASVSTHDNLRVESA